MEIEKIDADNFRRHSAEAYVAWVGDKDETADGFRAESLISR